MARITNKETMFYRYCWEFLHVYLPDRMGRSTHTIESYTDTLTIFKNYLIEQTSFKFDKFNFDNCTVDLIFSFMDWLSSKGNSNNTINHRLTGLKGYIYFCTTKDVSLNYLYSQICRIRPLKCQEQVKELLTDEQVALILKQAENNEKGRRNRVLLLTLFETAMRVSEIVNISTTQCYLDREHPYIKVYGKGNKERHIPISQKLNQILKKYLEKYKSKDVKWLFYTNHRGKQYPLSTRSIQDILTRYADLARKEDPSIPPKIHPHLLRASKATQLYRNGMAIELVSSLLGHQQIQTTRIYAKSSIELMRQEIEKSIPEESYKQQPKWKDDKDFMKEFGLR